MLVFMKVLVLMVCIIKTMIIRIFMVVIVGMYFAVMAVIMRMNV